MPDLDLLLGPPGTGKTTRLVQTVEQHVATHAPDTVALVSFTHAAADEARERVMTAIDRTADDLPHFRTVHSLAFRGLKLSRDDIFDRRSLAEFAERIGEDVTFTREPGDRGVTVGDAYLRAVEIAGVTGRSVEDAWLAHDDLVPGTSAEGAMAFAEAYRAFKREIGQLDFTDLLWQYAERGAPLDVSLAVIDEAQDLTAAQWAVVRRAFANADRLLVAGDDDQAIYEWAGADVARFLTLGDEARAVEVLRHSHRLPRAVHALASTIVQRIARRYAKAFVPRDEDGVVSYHGTLDSVVLTRPDTRILARNAYLLDDVEQRLREAGVVYTRSGQPSVHPGDVEVLRTWLLAARHGPSFETTGAGIKALYLALGRPAPSVRRHGTETLSAWQIDATVPWWEAFDGWSPARRDYYRTVLAEGRRLSAEPTVHLSTIHAAKGAQADHVVLLSDVSGRTAQKLDTDDEHRVFYVGVTRARRTLDIVAPYAGTGYLL